MVKYISVTQDRTTNSNAAIGWPPGLNEMGHISEKDGKKRPDRSKMKSLRLLTWNIRYDWMIVPIRPKEV